MSIDLLPVISIPGMTDLVIGMAESVDRTPSFQPHLPKRDRCFASIMRSLVDLKLLVPGVERFILQKQAVKLDMA